MEIGEDKRGIKSSSSVDRPMNLKEKEPSALRRRSAFYILNPWGSYSKVGKGVFLLSSAMALWLDPLFFYIIILNGDKKCLLLDRKLGMVAVFLRWSIDLIHAIYVACRLVTDFYFRLLYPQGDVDGDAWKITRRYLLSCSFIIDILAILPLPQVLILHITPMMKGSRILAAVGLLKFFVVFQYVPRVLRLFPLYTKGKEAFGKLAEAAWAKALLNLFLYLLLSHVLGALWYLLAIERVTSCWREACRNHPGCLSGSFSCDVTLGNHTFLNDFCPISSSNREKFDFGIYLYALESGIVKVTNFSQKFLLCFRWGIQNLSSCGQNLQTSVYIWENIFALFITISGLLSFLLLIGNMQIYLQTKTVRNEEKRLQKKEQKRQKMEEWKPFEQLSGKLQRKIIDNLKCIPRVLDLVKLHQDLPEDLSREMRRELAFNLLKEVPLFRLKRSKFLGTVCCYLKPVVYSEGTFIIQKGERISKMLFVVEGELKIEDSACDPTTKRSRGEVYFFRKKLLVLWDDSSPESNILVQALTKVEAFTLEFDDLKQNMSAMVVQSKWQRFSLRKRLEQKAVERDKRPRLLGTNDSKSSHAALAEWKPFKRLAGMLQWKVKDYLMYKPREIRGVDLVMLLHMLPMDLSKQMKSELCFVLLNKVEAFSLKGKKLLGALCFCAKPVLFTKGSYLFKEGDTIDQMLFIVQGKLRISSTSNNNKVTLKVGDFYGQELIEWVQESRSLHLPVSTKTIEAVTKVEVFALPADSLKRNWEVVHNWAVRYFQSTWSRHHPLVKAKADESLSDSHRTIKKALRSITNESSNSKLCASSFPNRSPALSQAESVITEEQKIDQ